MTFHELTNASPVDSILYNETDWIGAITNKHKHSKLTLLIILELEIISKRIMIFGLVLTQSQNFTN